MSSRIIAPVASLPVGALVWSYLEWVMNAERVARLQAAGVTYAAWLPEIGAASVPLILLAFVLWEVYNEN